MTDALTVHVGHEVAVFEPQAARVRDIKFDAVIDYAKRLKDWPLLEQAVDAKLEEQAEFVEWWAESLGKNHGGKRRGNQVPRTADLNVSQAETLTGISSQQVSKWAKRLKDLPSYRARLYGAAWKQAMGEAGGYRDVGGAGENEWNTPEKYIEFARQVLVEIDLDPATSEHAQKTVKAKRYFTVETNGLKQEWGGRVWMNPPYAQPLIYEFIEKLISECTSGRVEQAIVLTHNSTDTLWFHRLEEIAARICFTRGRIAFVDPRGERASPPQGQAFFYVGDRTECFDEVFRGIGFIR